MKRFLIEREIPGPSELTEAQLAGIAAKPNDVVASLGVPYRWITSYVAGDKIYCVHEADDEEALPEHARRGRSPPHRAARRRTRAASPATRPPPLGTGSAQHPADTGRNGPRIPERGESHSHSCGQS